MEDALYLWMTEYETYNCNATPPTIKTATFLDDETHG